MNKRTIEESSNLYIFDDTTKYISLSLALKLTFFESLLCKNIRNYLHPI